MLPKNINNMLLTQTAEPPRPGRSLPRRKPGPGKLLRGIQAISSYLLFVFLFFTLPAYAQTNQLTTVSAQDMLVNFVGSIPNLMRMTTAIAYVMGMYFIMIGVIKFKHFGEQRSMMSQEHSIKGPIIFLTVGALLLYLPTSVQVGMSTFWTDPNPYGYLEQEDDWAQFINDVFMIVQFIGVIAFIRGLVILSHLGSPSGGQQGALSKGVMHIVGGIFCINIYQFVQVIFATLGLSINV